MVDCHEFMIKVADGVTRDVSIFIPLDVISKKFSETALPQNLPVLVDKPRTRFMRARKAPILDDKHRFKDFSAFKDFFENDIETTLDLGDAGILIEAVFAELDEDYESVCVEDGIPSGVVVVQRSVRHEPGL